MTNALACGECGAGLPPPNAYGASFCVYCGTEHRERSSEVLAAAAALRDSSPDSSGVIPSLASFPQSALDLEDVARIQMTEAAVLHLARRHFESFESVFVCPHIPPKKEMAARRAHVDQLPPRERILALYDASWLGTGEEGFCITSKRLCWKNSGDKEGRMLLWGQVDPDRLYLDAGCLWIGDERIIVTDDAALDACANAFHVLALSATARPAPMASAPILRDTHPDPTEGLGTCHGSQGRERSSGPMGRSATPPPPHTTSYHAYATHAEKQEPDYSCWHCMTPLWKNTPQCAYCGAFPKPRKGWLRTG
jgi:hypothetical protein